jgi:protein-disulfide isomerase
MKPVLLALALLGIFAGAYAVHAADGSSALAAPGSFAASSSMLAKTDAPPPPAGYVTPLITERALGKADAPVTVHEFVSLTCSHCAAFYTEALPELKKRYIDTGKVKFVLHDYPLDGIALKAASLARCMPEEQFFPFIEILYKSQMAWAGSANPEKTLIQYAKLGGLPEDKANACLNDTKLQDEIVAERTSGEQKYSITGTPSFIINDGAQRLQGAQPVAAFAEIFDKLLAAKH